MSTIFADYQATTPVDPAVLEHMEPHWGRLFGNPHSRDHIIGWRAAAAVSAAASSVAALIGADEDEVVFTSGATEANNLAILGLARAAPKGRDRIVVSAVEHKCVLAAARALARRESFTVETVPVSCDGAVDLNALEAALDKDVLLVSVMAVNNEVGTVQDTHGVSELLRSRGIPFHCDAAQAPCALDVGELATLADLVSLSSHKMYGPQGIGALYIRRDLQNQLEPLIHGGGQQNGIRSGTLPLPLCVGMGAAAKLAATTDASSERTRIAGQRDQFIRLLDRGGAGAILNGPTAANRHPGNANLRFCGHDAHSLLGALQPNLAASTGAACTSGIPEPSHVLSAMGLATDEIDASIRFSFGRFTTDLEIREAAQLVLQALESQTSEHSSRLSFAD